MYWHLRNSMILSETLVKAKHQRDVWKRMSWESWQYMCIHRSFFQFIDHLYSPPLSKACRPIGSIANIYSWYNLSFNLATKTVNVGLCTCNTVGPTSHLIVFSVYVYAVYFYIDTFTKMTQMHYAMQYSNTGRWSRKLGYV